MIRKPYDPPARPKPPYSHFRLKQRYSPTFMPSSAKAPTLLTAQDCTGQIHLVIGSNPLASARCTKSIEVGAKPIVIAPAEAEVHYALLKKIEDGEIRWTRKRFEDVDLTTFGREDVSRVVDAVFVTLGGKNPLSTSRNCTNARPQKLMFVSRYTYLKIVPTATYTYQCR